MIESLRELTWVFKLLISESLDISSSLIESIEASFSINEFAKLLFFSSSSLMSSRASLRLGLLDLSVGSVPIAISTPSSKPSLSVSLNKSLVPIEASSSWFKPSSSISSEVSSIIVTKIDASSDSPEDREPLIFKVTVFAVS